MCFSFKDHSYVMYGIPQSMHIRNSVVTSGIKNEMSIFLIDISTLKIQNPFNNFGLVFQYCVI